MTVYGTEGTTEELVGPSACWGEADPLHQVQDLGS
jgi:hypothetical protein